MTQVWSPSECSLALGALSITTHYILDSPLPLSSWPSLRFAKIPPHPLLSWNWVTVSVFYLLIWEMSWDLNEWLQQALSIESKQATNKQHNNTVSSFDMAANSFMISRGWSHRQSRGRKGATPLELKGESRCSWWCVSGKMFVIHSLRMGETWLD